MLPGSHELLGSTYQAGGGTHVDSSGHVTLHSGQETRDMVRPAAEPMVKCPIRCL
jgi:hypothetical protein